MNIQLLIFCLFPLAVAACGPAAVANDTASTPAQIADDCPITQTPDPSFIPPAPYTPSAPYGNFWYGTNKLWTMLNPDGHRQALPHNKEGYNQKVFWWRDGYDMKTEEQPQITVIGRRLDGNAPAFEESGGTNGYHGEMGEFMLTGVVIPTTGCWEITGHYRDASLSFVVWVTP